MNSKKIIAFGVGVFSAAALTFSTVSPASAVDPVPTLIDAVCDVLPDSVTGLLAQVTAGNTAVTSSATDLATKKTALESAITQLIPAVVNHITAVSDGTPSAGTAGILTDKASGFADKVVAANNAMTASFEAQRSAYLVGLNSQYVTGVENGLCP